MGAYNWILIGAVCPVCRTPSRLRCQTHVASSFDAAEPFGLFHGREYQLGEKMAWFAPEHDRYRAWRRNAHDSFLPPDVDEEACYADCGSCNADSLFVIIRFRECVPEAIIGIGTEDEWPEGYLR